MSGLEPEGPRLRSVAGSGVPASLAPAGIGAEEALRGLPLTGAGAQGGLARRRLAPMVAGALRVAIDHVVEPGRGVVLRASADDATLEVRTDTVEFGGLAVAGEVLEAVEGHLGLVPGVPGTWMIRVPLLTPHETFLMLEQGELALAVPWHAVVRMRLAGAAELERSAGQDGYAVLPALSPLAEHLLERPVVLLGLGLRRAWLPADRIVWRMTAEPTDDPSPHGHGLGPMVRTVEGRLFAMVDTAGLLRTVPPPPVPHVRPAAPSARPAPPPPTAAAEPAPAGILPDLEPAWAERTSDSSWGGEPAIPSLASEEDAEEAADRDEAEHAIPAPERPILRLIELGAPDVEPLEDEAAPDEAAGPPPGPDAEVEEAAAPAVGEPAPAGEPVGAGSESAARVAEPAAPGMPAATETVVPPPAVRRALVAEDSIVAAIFLSRLLEREGFEVVTVGRATELHRELGQPWSVVFADVELPDATAGRALIGLEPRAADGRPAPVIALVRDADDAALAGAYGVLRTLSKPFEAERLTGLLRELGLGRG